MSQSPRKSASVLPSSCERSSSRTQPPTIHDRKPPSRRRVHSSRTSLGMLRLRRSVSDTRQGLAYLAQGSTGSTPLIPDDFFFTGALVASGFFAGTAGGRYTAAPARVTLPSVTTSRVLLPSI